MSVELFESYKIGKLELENRFVRSATWDATADTTGAVTDDSVAIYRKLGEGGVGLIISGYAFVSPHGQASRGQYSAHCDDMIPGLRKLVKVAHQGGAKIALQIVHAGINSGYLRGKGITPLAVSRMTELDQTHREMTSDEIEEIISDFGAAALRGKEAGFDAIQFHGAHGYLMSQFISPLFNLRSDQWGGSVEKRRKFHLEVVRSVRKAVGTDFPLMIKFGILDDKEGGLSLDEGVETARQMVEEGIDAIEVSAGVGSATRATKENESERHYFTERTAAVKRAVTVPIMAVGGLRSLKMAKSIVDSGVTDLISMCRPFIREPGLVGRWQRGDTKPAKCISCNRCFGVIGKGESLECGEERRLREETSTSS